MSMNRFRQWGETLFSSSDRRSRNRTPGSANSVLISPQPYRVYSPNSSILSQQQYTGHRPSTTSSPPPASTSKIPPPAPTSCTPPPPASTSNVLPPVPKWFYLDPKGVVH
ncbi:hypothetical protein V5O48_018291, partial [Marasmius crinis-equi]